MAIKSLLGDYERSQTVPLFQQEYTTLAQLSHPHIVQVYDFGFDGGVPYYVMELLSGESLRSLAPIPWGEASSLLRDVASALAIVHSRRLVHRDVTPRNIHRATDGRAKLEASGGITPETILQFGWADRISLGWLTQKSPAADVSLEWDVGASGEAR